MYIPPIYEPLHIPHAGVHFELNGKVYSNNSVVAINNIREGVGALLCKTNLKPCCSSPPNRFGQFYYPSGTTVPIKSHGEGFYRNRGVQEIRLNRRTGTTSPTGTYRCEIPNATGVTQNIYITLN